MKTDIRTACLSDAEDISVLLDQLQHPSTPEYICQQLKRIADNENEHVLVATARGSVVGLLALQITLQFHQEPPLARIIDLCVLDSHRGRMVGRDLIEAGEWIARNMGCIKLEVTANKARTVAHRFYERNGMVQTHRYFGKNLQHDAP